MMNRCSDIENTGKSEKIGRALISTKFSQLQSSSLKAKSDSAFFEFPEKNLQV